MELDVQCPPTWPADAKVVVVGEAPGGSEIFNREGFTGKAGDMLAKILFAGGIDIAHVAKTNVVKRAPDCSCGHHITQHTPTWQLSNRGQKELKYKCTICKGEDYNGFDSEHFKSTFYATSREGHAKKVQPTEELQAWTQELASELRVHKPIVAIAAGAEALQALCGIHDPLATAPEPFKTGITKYRGSVLPSTLVPGLWVVPIVHPSAILRSAQWQELYISSEIIRRKVTGIIARGSFEYEPWEEILEPTIEQAERFIGEIDGPFTLDIETTGGSVACIGLCYFNGRIDRAICVPIQTQFGPWFPPEDEWTFWRLLYRLSQTHKLIGHNLGYDLDWICRYGIDPVDFDDTMLMFHRMYPELPKGLAFVNMWLTDIPYYKDDGKEAGYRTQGVDLYKYNIKDVVSDHRIWRRLVVLGETVFKQPWKLYNEYTKQTFPLAFEMQILGMDADPDDVGFARNVLTSELAKIRERLHTLSNGTLALREGNKKITDKQVADYLYKDLGLPIKRNRKTKSITADEDALIELLIQRPDLEVLKAINAERKFGKALNSYIDISWEP